jgi:outer membrane protein OmpA-like peptidoglycan-associated protein
MKSFNKLSIAILASMVFLGCSTAQTRPVDSSGEKCEKISVTAFLPPVTADLDFQYILFTKDQVIVQGGYQHTLSVAGQAEKLNQQPVQTFESPIIPVNAIAETETILFGFDSSSIATEEQAKLEKLVQKIENAGLIQLRIEGHTDSTGGAGYNEKLSVKRAKYVQDYLLQRGIEKPKISLKGYGESQPLEPNDTADHRAKNRRVTLIPETEK